MLDELKTLSSWVRGQPGLVKTAVVGIPCSLAAAGLVYAARRQSELKQQHLMVATGTLVTAATATTAYEVSRVYLPERVQRLALPALQIVKDVPGMVAVAYGSIRAVDRLNPAAIIAISPATTRFLNSAPMVVGVTGTAAAIVAWLDPEPLVPLDTGLDRWSFAYRTLFCGPLVAFMAVTGTLAFRCSYKVSGGMRARALFSAGSLFSIGGASFTYMLWPALHALTGQNQRSKRLYVVTEAAIWGSMGIFATLTLAWPYRRSVVDHSIEEFEQWNRSIDRILDALGWGESSGSPKDPEQRLWIQRVRDAIQLYNREVSEEAAPSISKEEERAAEMALCTLRLSRCVSGDEWNTLLNDLRTIDEFTNRYPEHVPKQASSWDSSTLIEGSRMALILGDHTYPTESLPPPLSDSDPARGAWARLTAVCAAESSLLPASHHRQVLDTREDDLAQWCMEMTLANTRR